MNILLEHEEQASGTGHNRPHFTTRAATDNDHKLESNYGSIHPQPGNAALKSRHGITSVDTADATDIPPSSHAAGEWQPLLTRKPVRDFVVDADRSRNSRQPTAPKSHGTSAKLGTFAGVFVPTALNVLSILMFLRFGFVLGQGGILGTMGMLLLCYLIDLITVMSISAIATNGTVRGGGAYYLISRSLGPEFGGSIGIVFYLGLTLNTGLNAVGLVQCLKLAFGSEGGNLAQFLYEGYTWEYLWATIILILCTAICLAGSAFFARAGNGLLLILLIATFSIPLSTLFVRPFKTSSPHVDYTGLSLQTLKENIFPNLTKGADGSQLNGRETYQDLFGILFPATSGIFAGASMSGDLQNPSRSIPRGTLTGLALTFTLYTLVVLAMAASITRDTLYHNVNIIQDVNMSGVLVLLGEFATSFFSSLMGVIGSAKLLQALARDHLIPGSSVFGTGSKSSDDPIYAILFTYVVAQLTMLFDINQIASFVTMTFLMTFLVTNLACFLLKISSAPNFRPSFRYFNSWTAAIGTVASGATMFFVDGMYASMCVGILIAIFLVIHYTTPPKAWGDVSQSLIYHQVRKYLLRLRHDHVKYWRPQILLFVNDPRRSYKLIQFCNSLKKGALFILGHVIVTQDFGSAVPEARKQREAWTKYIDFSRIKAFVNVAISPGVEWGARNIVLSAGLGGMRPNIVVMGFYNLPEYRLSQPLLDAPPLVASQPTTPNQTVRRRRKTIKHDALRGQLPTDTNRPEKAVGAQNYVTILEDLLLRLQVNVAIAKGFNDLELPERVESGPSRLFSFFNIHRSDRSETSKKYIDLWPIQMSAEISGEGSDSKQNVTTTNFDTYTLILQLGCILNTVPTWKRTYSLRVIVFVEYETDVEEERGRVEELLATLRIPAEVLVFHLACGTLKTYEIIVNGNYHGLDIETQQHVDGALQSEDWWHEIKARRDGADVSEQTQGFEGTTPQQSQFELLKDLNKHLQKRRRRPSMVNLSKLGVSLTMQTQRLDPDMISNHPAQGSASSSNGSDTDTDTLDNTDPSNEEFASPSFDDLPVRGAEYESLPSGPGTSSPYFMTRQKPSIRVSSHNANTLLISHPEASSVDGSTPAGDNAEALLSSSLPLSGSDDATMATESVTILPSKIKRPQRRPFNRHKSQPSFSSNPVPRTTVATDDGPGPSIMFQTPSPPRRDGSAPSKPTGSIYDPQYFPHLGRRRTDSSAVSVATSQSRTSSTSGFPLGFSQNLSFNSLPCRAQHLILNELMRRHSGSALYHDEEHTAVDMLLSEAATTSETAVIFTTLPAPAEGTCESEEDSLRYLGDLETLCDGLPPVLMVHSNSMTVTVNL